MGSGSGIRQSKAIIKVTKCWKCAFYRALLNLTAIFKLHGLLFGFIASLRASSRSRGRGLGEGGGGGLLSSSIPPVPNSRACSLFQYSQERVWQRNLV